MDSIGEKLREARKLRDLSIKDVARDTNISPGYLEALEEEDFDRFPGETYLIGFLKSYAEFLKLDPEQIVQAYKGYKIGESATPLEELTKSNKSPIFNLFDFFNNTRNKNFAIFLVILFVGIFLLRGLYYFVNESIDVSDSSTVEQIRDDYNTKNPGTEIGNITNIQMNNDRSIVIVSKNEAIQFLVGQKEIIFHIRSIGKDYIDILFLQDNELYKLEHGKEKIISISSSSRELIFRLKALTQNKATLIIKLGKKSSNDDEESDVVKDLSAELTKDNSSVLAQNSKSLKIIFNAEFTQKSFIELYLDGQKKERGFINAGQKIRWEASEYIQVKIGNAGGVKANINGKEIVFGKSGQVVNKIIKWKKDLNNPNLYNIVVKDW